MSPWIWFCVAGIMMIAEFFVPGVLYFTLIGISSFLTGVATYWVHDILYIFLIFLVLNILQLIFVKPILAKWFAIDKIVQPSPVDAMIGKIAVATKDITLDSGECKVDGEIWGARRVASSNDVKEGTKVVVEKVDSTILWVRERGENE